MQRLPVIFFITFFFGILYSLLDKMNPNSFGFKSALDPFYFSFTTMSTAGYGDYSPKNDVAKMLVMVQQAVLIGEIISLLGLDTNTKISNRVRQFSTMLPTMKTA